MKNRSVIRKRGKEKVAHSPVNGSKYYPTPIQPFFLGGSIQQINNNTDDKTKQNQKKKKKTELRSRFINIAKNSGGKEIQIHIHLIIRDL